MKTITMLACLGALAAVLPGFASSHCDTMNGPVVIAAKNALETGDVNLVLIWVQPKDEPQIREAFQKTLSVRKLNPQAKDLADMYFFETIVRIHRAGEGVAYTGLKPAGAEVDPGIAAADEAIEKGNAEELLKHVSEAVHNGIHVQYSNVIAKKKYAQDDVAAGRAFVAAYVEFIHYVERLYQTASSPAKGHFHEGGM